MPEAGGGSVQLLEADPDLARGLDPRRIREVSQRLFVRAIDAPRGTVDPWALAEPGQPADRPARARRPARPRGDRRRPPVRRAARPGRPPARLGRPRRRDPAPAHGRVDRADALPARDHRPGARRAGRAVARDLRRARRARRAPRRAARGHAGDRAPHARRRPAAGAAVVPGRALGPRGPRRRARQPAPPPPHPRRHGRRPPPVGHDGAGPADRARGDRAPPRRRLAAAGRPAGAALRRPRRRAGPIRFAARSAVATERTRCAFERAGAAESARRRGVRARERSARRGRRARPRASAELADPRRAAAARA